MKKLMLLIILVSSAVYSQTKEAASPIDRYYSAVTFGILICSITFSKNQALAQLPPEPDAEKTQTTGECIDEKKREIRIAYDNLYKVIKKPSAKAALKEHYFAAVASLNGIKPESGEIKMLYSQRQAANAAKLDDKWERFELER